jgi:hypothetical protein
MLASIPARTLNPIRSRRGIPRFSLFGKCSNRDLFAIRGAQSAPCRLGEADLARRQQVGGYLIKRGDDRTPTARQSDTCVRGEAFGSAHRAILVCEGDGFVMRLDAEPAGAQHVPAFAWRRRDRAFSGALHRDSPRADFIICAATARSSQQ